VGRRRADSVLQRSGARSRHSGSTLFGIDEFHPRLLEPAADRQIVGSGERARARHRFGTLDGRLDFFLLSPAQPHAWAAAVLVDQFDSCGLQCVLQCIHSPFFQFFPALEPCHRINRNF
jgi:hypothetical protein